MYQSDNVLVVVDFRQPTHHALPRALELAKQFGSKLTIATCVYQKIVEHVPDYSGIDLDRIESEAKAHYEDKMRDYVSEFNGGDLAQKYEIDFEVIWNKSFHQGLLEFINEKSFDLVVKTAHFHGKLEKLLFTPTDWHLLRDTETNVLFVKKGAWPSNTTILGAINIDDDEDHQRLNKEIVATTAQLSEACSSEPKILNVFPWATINLDKFKYLFEKKDQFTLIKEAHRLAVIEYVKDYPKLTDNVIVAEGIEPEITIPEVIKSSFADLLIMGCVRRKGFAGWVIGNTVEKILDDLNCEVLVLK